MKDLTTFFIGIAFLTGCGGGFAQLDSNPSSQTIIGVVPRLTSPVGNESTSSTSEPVAFSDCPGQICLGYWKTNVKIQSLFSNAKQADQAACYTEVGLAAVAPEFTDGRDFYVRQDANFSKFRMKISNGRLESYRFFSCHSGTQIFSALVDVSGGSVSYAYKFIDAGLSEFALSASGDWREGRWSNKMISTHLETQANYDSTEIAQFDQTATYSRLQFALNQRTDPTKNLLLWAQMGLSVNGYTPTIGDGSANLQIGSSAAMKPLSWNLSAGTESINLSGTYATEANASSLPALPSSSTISFSPDEAWDCIIPSGASEIEDVAGWRAAISAPNKCN